MQKRAESLSDRFIDWSKKYPWVYSIVAILLVYWRLPMTYFQQDEWMAFETYIGSATQSVTSSVTVQRPLTCVVNSGMWHFFGTNATYYGLFSLLLILVIGLLFHRVLRRLGVPPFAAAIGSMLFPIFVAGSQAITWFGAFSATLPSFIFALLAIDLFLSFIKEYTWRHAVLAVLATLVSLYFKEETLWLFPVFLTIWYLYLPTDAYPRNIKNFLIRLSPFIASGAAYLFFERLRQAHSQSFSTLVSTTDTSHYMIDVVNSLVYLPLTHLSHILFGPEAIIALSTFLKLTVMQFSLATSLILIAIFIFVLYRATKNERPAILVLMVWMLTGFSSYAIFGKNPEFLEGRYYFDTQAAVVALLAIGLMPANFTNKIRSFNTVGVAVMLLLVGTNIALADQRMNATVALSQERRNILTYIQKHTGPLPKKAIIYTESTNFGYAGQAAYLLPFQNGMATIFRVLYQGKNQDYRELSKKQAYLWDFIKQGYDEVDGVGFGYFREYDALAKALKEYNLPLETVYAFRYSGATITDTTSLTRGKLFISNGKLNRLPRTSWKVSTSNDQGIEGRFPISRALDDDIKTDWLVPHRYGEYVEVDFGKPISNVSEIVLQSGDGNSFPRIVNFKYSPDGIKWIDDFTDVGLMNGNAEVPFIFGPKTMQKFRVTLVDKRETIFAWSLSDLNVFTADAE